MIHVKFREVHSAVGRRTAATAAFDRGREYEWQMNRNPEIDWRAYETVRRCLSQLLQKEEIEEAKALALKLMQKGSFQIDTTGNRELFAAGHFFGFRLAQC